MPPRIAGLGSLLLAGFLVSCEAKSSDLKVGGVYSVKSDGKFKVIKVLVVDDGAVHIRLYKNSFPERPSQVDPARLGLGSMNDKDGFGMGHLPLSAAGFAAWEPVFLSQSSVSPDELEGYKMWKESGGGVFQ